MYCHVIQGPIHWKMKQDSLRPNHTYLSKVSDVSFFIWSSHVVLLTTILRIRSPNKFWYICVRRWNHTLCGHIVITSRMLRYVPVLAVLSFIWSFTNNGRKICFKNWMMARRLKWLTNSRIGPIKTTNQKSVFLGTNIPILKVRQSWDRLIFIMGSSIPIRRHHCTERATIYQFQDARNTRPVADH